MADPADVEPAGVPARVLAHPAVARLARRLAERPGARLPVAEPARRAAVALVLRLGRDEPAAEALELLLIKRAVFEGDPWSGHVALPGGRWEPGESLLETALRETREETALDLARDARVLGTLDELQPRTPVLPPIVIAPFVFALVADGAGELLLSHEVAEAFWVPVTALQDPAASRDVILHLGGGPRSVPSFGYRDYTIWGLTERILRQFLEYLGS